MKPIIIKLDDGTDITAHVDESDFAKLNKTTTLNKHTNTLCTGATISSSRTRTGYERVKFKEHYYTSAHDYYCSSDREEKNTGLDIDLFERGDYVNDEQLYNDRKRARVLHDRLEQWQALNDEPVDWGNSKEKVWYIEYDYTAQSIIACYTLSVRPVGTLGFSTHEKAQEAIDVFRDELMWYYTEYRSRLDEPERKDDK